MGYERVQFTSDKFKKSRGGHSRWLLLSCVSCGESLFCYQKDGSGILKRLYIDRIVGDKKKKNLVCQKCKTVLGIFTLYKKEKRPAFRLFVGAVAKKTIPGDKVKKFF